MSIFLHKDKDTKITGGGGDCKNEASNGFSPL